MQRVSSTQILTAYHNLHELDSSQSILKEISPECSVEGLMLRLKLQYFDHLMRRVDSLEKTLMLGEIGERELELYETSYFGKSG